MKKVIEASKKMSWILAMRLNGSLEEITGRGWIFVMVIIGIVMVFGPMVYHLVSNNVGSSINTVSAGFNFSGLS